MSTMAGGDADDPIPGGPEESHTTPRDGDSDTEREDGLDWPADPDELTDELTDEPAHGPQGP